MVTESCLVTVALAACVVMAGSGDLELTKLVRVLALRIDVNILYGSHMASGMALGLLYLGGATYTLSTSNTAVAALVSSLVPIFPVTTIDNVFHLQALRHLWVLAAEQRHVCAINAITRAPVAAAVRFGDETVHFSPAIIPEKAEVVRVTSEGYLPVCVSDSTRPLKVANIHFLVFLSPKIAKVFMQPCVSSSASAAERVHKWLRELNLDDADALDGWSVALLRCLGKLTTKEKERFALPHSELVRDCLQRKGAFPPDKCDVAGKVSVWYFCSRLVES